MPRAKLVLWRQQSDLINVRSAFYPPPESQERRYEAIAMVRAWSIRGKVSHAIECTALLTEAILNDTPNTSQLLVRLAYSAAFCRFVTSLTEQHGRSMFLAAQHVGLPAAFVELRHAATHIELPSLAVLRNACRKSLDWLWTNFWVTIDADETDGVTSRTNGASHMDGESDPFRDVLKSYRDTRREQIRSNLPFDGHLTDEAVQKIKRDCTLKDGKVSELVDCLLTERFIVPAGRSLGDKPMQNTAFNLWDDILKELSMSMKALFLPAFLDGLLDRLCEESASSVKLDTYRESLYYWAFHILSSDEWEETLQSVNIELESVIDKCLYRPNDWSVRIVSLLTSTDSLLLDKYGELTQLARMQVNASSLEFSADQLEGRNKEAGADESIMSVSSAIREEIKRYEQWRCELEDQDSDDGPDIDENPAGNTTGPEFEQEFQKFNISAGQRYINGWRKPEGPWIPKPLGVV